MDITHKGIYETTTYKYKSGESEIAFMYNIIMPDFILFTVSISVGFILLITCFGSTN